MVVGISNLTKSKQIVKIKVISVNGFYPQKLLPIVGLAEVGSIIIRRLAISVVLRNLLYVIDRSYRMG